MLQGLSLKAVETAFAYKAKDRRKNCIRLFCNVPIIGGLAGLILLVNHAFKDLGKDYHREITAAEALDENPNDAGALQFQRDLRKTRAKANSISYALLLQAVIGFTPISFMILLPVQLIMTAERYYRKS